MLQIEDESESQIIQESTLEIIPSRETAFTKIYLSESESSWITIGWLSAELEKYSKENYQSLFDIHPLNRGKVVMHNNEECISPRWHRSYLHQPKRELNQQQSYMYSGFEEYEDLNLPIPFQKFLDFLNEKEENYPFNQVIVNWYANGKDHIAPHSDCEKGIIPDAGIKIITLCEDEKQPRELRITPKKLKDDINDNLYAQVKIQIKHGCIITMGGEIQKKFKHRIPKAIENPTSRISLTFRKFL